MAYVCICHLLYRNFKDTDTASRPTSKLRPHKRANNNLFPKKTNYTSIFDFFEAKSCIFDLFLVILRRICWKNGQNADNTHWKNGQNKQNQY